MKIILTFIFLLAFVLGLIVAIICIIRKVPAKKALVLIGISVITYNVAAFMPEPGTERNESVTTESDDMEGPDNTEVAEEIENTEYIDSDMPLTTLTDFSEERAFVQFTDYSEEDLKMSEDGVRAALSDDEDEAVQYAMKYMDYEPQGGNRIALIDTKGKIIWKSKRTLNDQSLTEISEFRDGLAYFIFDGNEGKSYNIIDLEGNVSYTKECSEDFMILSHGGGLFLVAQHIVNFDVDEWQIGTIDKDGDIVAEYKSYEIITPQEEPLPVEEPADPSSELQDIDDALTQLEEERQAWLNECQDYEGEEDEEYRRMVEETTAEYQNKRDELIERKSQLQEQYDVQFEEYEEYQMELGEYETARQHAPATIAFDEYTVYEYQQRCEYLGEHIFKVPLESGFAILNMDSQNVIGLNRYAVDEAYVEQFVTDFDNGVATILYSEPVDWDKLEQEDVDVDWAILPTNLYSLCHMETDGTINLIASNSWTKYVLPHILNDENKFHDGLLFVPYGGDDATVYMDKEYYAFTRDEETALKKGFIFNTGVYYDIEGEVVLELSEYNGNREYFCDPFYSGQAIMLMQGADQLSYFTVIDKSGKLQFEPRSGFDDVYMSQDGNYLTAVGWKNLEVLDTMGNVLVSVNDEQISSENGLSRRHEQISLDHKYDVCDGVIRFNCYYVNVKDGIVIGSDPYTDVDVEFSAIGYQADTSESEQLKEKFDIEQTNESAGAESSEQLGTVTVDEAERMVNHWLIDHPIEPEFQSILSPSYDGEKLDYEGDDSWEFDLWIDGEEYAVILVHKDDGDIIIEYYIWNEDDRTCTSDQMPIDQWYTNVYLGSEE